MISITKEEKAKIVSKFPNVHIVRTMKQDSRRHHYYMAEERGPMRMLHAIRSSRVEGRDAISQIQ